MSDQNTPPNYPSYPDNAARGSAPGASGWERGVLEKLALAALNEQRAARRWGIFFKLLTFGYLALIFVMIYGDRIAQVEPKPGARHTALVSLEGEIAADTDASAERITQALTDAFKDHATAGVILRINSPGGSPVQAGMIYDEIRRLRAQYPDKPLYVVVEEMCASGGYYAAVAADKIFVDKASIVGSIGVLMDSFGLTGTMDKLGVERRLLTAGSNKGIGDPFSPENPEQRQYLLDMLDEIHQQFIKVVREGRGSRLKESKETFSGLFWTGAKSVEIGLADGFGTVDSVARDVVKAETVVDYTVQESFAERFARRFGAALGSGTINALRQSVGWR